jgi:hypothetical protein
VRDHAAPRVRAHPALRDGEPLGELTALDARSVRVQADPVAFNPLDPKLRTDLARRGAGGRRERFSARREADIIANTAAAEELRRERTRGLIRRLLRLR